jgi:hypothetical protein
MGRRVGDPAGGCADNRLQNANCKMQIAKWKRARRALFARRLRGGAGGRWRVELNRNAKVRLAPSKISSRTKSVDGAQWVRVAG